VRYLIGLMSGTSMDGIDAALVDGDKNSLITGITRPYSDSTKQFLNDVMSNEHSSFATLSQLNTILGREFACAALALLDMVNIPAEQIIAIGSHGQTICHDAAADIPYTVQLGCPHTIAELTGIDVVADFRTRDLMIGGQGAPFAPIYHQVLFGDNELPIVVVNIGGIANVTFLAQGITVSGYDVGPGNCLMDSWIQKHLGLAYDASGEWAATGQVISTLLTSMLADPYFKLPAPKSLGKEYFSQQWLATYLQSDFLPQDIQATLVAFTATTIANAIRHSSYQLKRLVVCGGGVHNTALQYALGKQLPNLKIDSTSSHDVNPDFLEAMMFAWLADKAMNRIPLDFTKITGATHPAVYGVIYPRRIDKINSIGM